MLGVRHLLLGLVSLICLLGMTSCGIHRVYGGKVIDTDTREPIEGAVVVAYWLEARATIAGESTRLEDVKEALTDREGKWSITGPRGQEGCSPVLLFTFLTGTHYTREPDFIVFKPGYCSWPKGFFIDACKRTIKPGGTGGIIEGQTIELSQLKKEEDRIKSSAIGPLYGDDKEKEKEFLKKQREFIRLLNQEHKSLGLQEYRFKE